MYCTDLSSMFNKLTAKFYSLEVTLGHISSSAWFLDTKLHPLQLSCADF